jgi:hypothetical protein
MLKLAALASVIIALHPAPVFAGACAQPPPAVLVLTANDATIASGGGVIAELDQPAFPAWGFVGSKPLAAAAFAPLAPGLYRLAVPAKAGWATLEQRDPKTRTPLVRVQRAAAKADAPATAAPAVRAVEYAEYSGRRGTSRYVTVELTAPPPAGAIALVLYGVAKAGNVPRSWALMRNQPTPTTTSVTVYASGSCIVQPAGVVGSAVGDQVALAWVDASGRVSAPSATLAVTAKAMTP